MTSPTPARHLKVPGTSNFRDLGGYRGHGGREVRWRVLFRSDHLADLTPQGLEDLQLLGVTRSIDFRGDKERAADAYAWQGLETRALSVEPTMVQKAMALMHSGGSMTVEETVSLMQDTYRSFVRENADKFAQFFQLLLAHETPTVFHCTAGKDRTGWAAALILEALGVARGDIEHDYLLTNQFYQRPAALASRAAQSVPQEVLHVLWRVQPAFLASAYTMVEQEFGGMDAYLQDVIGVDAHAQRALRARYLEA